MHWIKKEGDKPCNRVEIKSDGAFRKVFECDSEWEVQDVYFNEMNRDHLTVHFKKKEEPMAKKYVIELEDKVSENAKGEKLYFVKGFNNLSLDETAIKKLTPYEEPAKEEHEFEIGDVVLSWPKFARGAKRVIVSIKYSSYALLGDDNKIYYISHSELESNPKIMSWTGDNVSDKLKELFNE